jgi:hypothetical protein
MERLVTGVFVACMLAFASIASAFNDISMDPPPEIVSPGDVLTLRGKNRFNPG